MPEMPAMIARRRTAARRGGLAEIWQCPRNAEVAALKPLHAHLLCNASVSPRPPGRAALDRL